MQGNDTSVRFWHTAQRRCAEDIFTDPVMIALIELSNLVSSQWPVVIINLSQGTEVA
jgi:hypothetical protein